MHDTNIQRRRHPRRLRNACRSTFAALAFLASASLSYAQSYPNGLNVDSVHPDVDAAFIGQMRARMDSIHRSEHRPTVALVLSGGGAKGASQVGVMKYLQDKEIPVDMICGTSIGGLIGGLLSVGYQPEYIEQLFRSQDWSVTLTDKVDPKYYSVNNKLYKQKFVISIPFHYRNQDFQKRVMDQVKYSDSDGHLHMGAGDGAMDTRVGINSLANSLPSGYVYGFNVNNLLSSLTVGYQDSLDFKDLPIPFFCVAADLLSCKAKNWGTGELKTAMRSTMSIPGLFDPVRTEGLVLVDGGIRDNFPIDLARAMGADLVIGVDLSDQKPVYSELNNIGSFVGQFIRMLGQESFQRNVGDADVFIKPDTRGYNMLSFNPTAIDTLVHRGYLAAAARGDQLDVVKSYMKDAKPRYNSRPAINLADEKVQLSAIIFDGLSNVESRMMQRKIGLKAGEFVGKEDMDEAMNKLQATACFESLTYSLLGKEAPYRLVFNCNRSPVHQVGLGVRLDTDEWASVLLNVGLNAHKLSGLKLDLTTKIGKNKYADLRFSLDLPWVPTLNLEAKVGDYSAQVDPFLTNLKYDVGYFTHQESLYLSNIRWTNFDFQLGVRNRYYKGYEDTPLAKQIIEINPKMAEGCYGGFFGNAHLYTMDSKAYPSKGADINLGYDMDVVKVGCPDFKPLHLAKADFRFVLPIGQVVALVPDIHLRGTIFNRNLAEDFKAGSDAYSIGHQIFVGGAMPDRCIDGQIPFVGFNSIYAAYNHVAVINLDLRFKAGKNFYVSALGGYLRDADTIKEFVSSLTPTYWGTGLELGYDTIAGPLKIRGSWYNNLPSNIWARQNFGLYLSYGFDF